MKKHFLTVIALLCALSLVLCGCGKKEPQVQAPAETAPFGLSDVKLTTSTWSSPNGATVHLRAVPYGYKDGQSALFLVRQGTAEVASIPCQWDGTAYTADAELNAADGLSYSVLFTDHLGFSQEIPVDAPESLVNMASALESYCTLLVEKTEYADGKLTVSEGTVTVQVPQITDGGHAVTVTDAKLILTFEGREVSSTELDLSSGAAEYSILAVLTVPELENDQQVVLSLEVTLSNGYVLTDEGGTFFYNEGELLTAVG